MTAAPPAMRSHTETTETRCSVPFGKPYKMELPQAPGSK